MPNYAKHYREMYLKLTDADRVRLWIQLSHGPRSEFVKVQAHLSTVAHDTMAAQILWKPEK